jgi:hypothetical protein
LLSLKELEDLPDELLVVLKDAAVPGVRAAALLEVAKDKLGHTRRLRLALDFEGAVERDLEASGDRLESLSAAVPRLVADAVTSEE